MSRSRDTGLLVNKPRRLSRYGGYIGDRSVLRSLVLFRKLCLADGKNSCDSRNGAEKRSAIIYKFRRTTVYLYPPDRERLNLRVYFQNQAVSAKRISV